ncbi:MAG: phage regulatory protein/antirepressor Ant [Tannerellaceae bacterium]|jgi:anti-repressor protein|nr:phage regulatory protein/antirepressor Ant [Tannerellaceae bacterium]
MNELVFRSKKGTLVTTSLLVAEKFGKEHRNVLQQIRNLTAENAAVNALFYETDYYNERNQRQPMFVMNRDGFSLLVMGFTGKEALKFKLDYIGRFNQMEALIQKEIERQRELLEAQRPKVWFSDSFNTSDTIIGIGDLAKLLRQKGIDIGQNRLFGWMVEHHYLMVSGRRYSKTKGRYEKIYMPTQRAAALGIFHVIKRPIPVRPGEPSVITTTIKVKGKGVNYFMERFLYHKEEASWMP